MSAQGCVLGKTVSGGKLFFYERNNTPSYADGACFYAGARTIFVSYVIPVFDKNSKNNSASGEVAISYEKGILKIGGNPDFRLELLTFLFSFPRVGFKLW